MGLRDEIDVCELIAEKDPQHLLPGSAEFAKRLLTLSEQPGADQ
jgi:hypothetical protein